MAIEMRLEFRVLASSSAGCCYLLTSCGAKPLLIEAGLRLGEIQRAINFSLSKLAGCIITHSHVDHARSASALLKRAVTVYASQETLSVMQIASHHRAKAIVANETVEIDEWRVLPFEAVHDVPTFGFVIDGPRGGRLLYLTDTAYSKYKFEGLTHIAAECNYSRELLRQNTLYGGIHAERYKRTLQNHMSVERLIELLRANDLSLVREIHLLHLSDKNSNETEFADAVRRATGKPVYVASKSGVIHENHHN